MTDTLRVLVIDDLRTARDTEQYPAVYARDTVEGIKALSSKQQWDLVFLDHDLGIDFETGNYLTIIPVVDYITDHRGIFEKTMFTVISSSPRAGYIVQALETASLNVDRWTIDEVSSVFKTENFMEMARKRGKV